MATKTIKNGDTVTIKETGETGKVLNIENGYYLIENDHWRWPHEIVSKKTTPPQKPRTPIKKKSAKLSILKVIYQIIAADYLRHNKRCMARFAGCTEKSTEIHHMFIRTGWYLIMTNLFLPICRSCHKHATTHSKEAIEAGVSVSRTADVPVSFTNYEKSLLKKHNINHP